MHDIICCRYPLDTGTVCWYLHCCFSWMERHRLAFLLPKLILFCCLLILHNSLFGPFSERMLWTIILLYTFWSDIAFTRSSLSMWESLDRAVKKFLSSRLIMNSRWLWNLHQRHKFLRAEASRDILKFRVSEIVFPGVFKRYFPLWMPCCFVGIHARLETMSSKCPRRSTTSHGSNVSQIWTCLNMRSMSF